MTTDDLSDQNEINYDNSLCNMSTLDQNYITECCCYNMKDITFGLVSQA